MALDDAGLESTLLSILDGTTELPTVAAAAAAWGDMIEAYALTGEVLNPGPLPQIIPPTSLPTLKTALEAAFGAGAAAGAATAIGDALDAYWVTITYSGVPGVPGGTSAFKTALGLDFQFVGGTHASKASSISGWIATFTKAVAYTYPGPTPPAGTILVS
jgi:hypothetical protein